MWARARKFANGPLSYQKAKRITKSGTETAEILNYSLPLCPLKALRNLHLLKGHWKLEIDFKAEETSGYLKQQNELIANS